MADLPDAHEAFPDHGDEGAPPALEGVTITTSGSTGVPKRVRLSGEALRASAEATARRIGEGRWLLALPTDYIAGHQVLVRSAVARTVPVRLDGPFRSETFAEATRELGHAHDLFTALVPAQLATLLRSASERPVLTALRAYRAILVGGQSLPIPLREEAAALGVRLVRTYGSTETSGGCVYDGVPLDIASVRTVAGELQISGPMLADEYQGDAEGTARVFVHDAGARWYRTGDIGDFVDGVVQVHGRADNVIISGGVNISLDRVEQAVRGVPGLTEAVVVGIPDERWGEASAVVVALRPEHVEDGMKEDLVRRARDAVAAVVGKAARPARLLVLEELPRLPSGKPDRAAIRRLIGVP